MKTVFALLIVLSSISVAFAEGETDSRCGQVVDSADREARDTGGDAAETGAATAQGA
jgi:hypothetical protein